MVGCWALPSLVPVVLLMSLALPVLVLMVMVTATESGEMRQYPAFDRVPDSAGYSRENPATSGKNRQRLFRRILPDLIKLLFCSHILGLACLPASAHETHLNQCL